MQKGYSATERLVLTEKRCRKRAIGISLWEDSISAMRLWGLIRTAKPEKGKTVAAGKIAQAIGEKRLRLLRRGRNPQDSIKKNNFLPGGKKQNDPCQVKAETPDAVGCWKGKKTLFREGNGLELKKRSRRRASTTKNTPYPFSVKRWGARRAYFRPFG